MAFDINNIRIGVIGLGYVGLPLAVEFGRKYPTVGFDVKESRVAELEAGTDSTLEASDEELASAKKLGFTSNADDLADCNFYVVTVPTPIGEGNRPLLTPLRSASETIGKLLNDPALYNKALETVANVRDLSVKLEPLVNDLRMFADALARDPGQLGVRGALRNRDALNTGYKGNTVGRERIQR